MLLVIDHHKTILRYQNGNVRMEREGRKPQYIPVQQLDQVIVYGNPVAECAVWRVLSQAGVCTVFLPGRGHPGHALLASGLAMQLPLRRLQHTIAACQKRRLQLAKYTVEQKFKSYPLALASLQEHYAVSESECQGFLEKCAQSLEKLPEITTLSQLLGLEGQLAQAWFRLLSQALSEPWGFKGRNRQPPRDPVNALLSLSYTLMTAEVRQMVLGSGLDPSLGFLHQDYPGRDSLVLDVAEWFRAGVDQFVLNWLTQNALEKSHFYYREDSGCRLSKTARPLFYKAWGQYRYQWPHPFTETTGIEDAAPEGHPTAPSGVLPEIIYSQVQRLRTYMQELDDDPILVTTSDGA